MTDIPTPDALSGNHTAAYAAAAGKPEAHKAMMLVAKALAHTGFRVLDDDEFYTQVWLLNMNVGRQGPDERHSFLDQE